MSFPELIFLLCKGEKNPNPNLSACEYHLEKSKLLDICIFSTFGVAFHLKHCLFEQQEIAEVTKHTMAGCIQQHELPKIQLQNKPKKLYWIQAFLQLKFHVWHIPGTSRFTEAVLICCTCCRLNFPGKQKWRKSSWKQVSLYPPDAYCANTTESQDTGTVLADILLPCGFY